MATSLASSVGTRVESASRHMLQCRVHKDRYLSWNVPNETLRRNKHQYSMTKDELAVDSACSLFPAKDHVCKQPHPYPRVLTTWRGMDERIMGMYCFIMAQPMTDYFRLLRFINDPNADDGRFGIGIGREAVEQFQEFIHADPKRREGYETIPDFRAMGYSVGTGYAHEYNGDTIASVMIGGLVTVQNGKYPMHTGDPVTWYVQYVEDVCFDEFGKRIENSVQLLCDKIIAGPGSVDHARPIGKQGHSMRNSGFGDTALKDNIFLPKPYFYEHASFGDTKRVFAKCLSNAAPYERVDIMIARQSL
jgi:hypothetical protein